MKRWIGMMLAMILCLSLCACGNVSTSFEKAVEKGDYAKAVELFQSEICFDPEKREQANHFLQQYLLDAIADFNSGKIDYDKACDAVDTAAWVGALSNDEISDTFYELSTLQESKAAYQAALSLLEDELYMDALYNFQCVAETDSNYKSAQEKITAILTDVLTELTKEVEDLSAKGEYRQALAAIDKVINVAGNSTEIETLRRKTVAKYTDYSLSQAEKAFAAGEDGKDYTAAAAIIVAAIDDVGEDARLTAALEEYESYAPVYLAELDYFDRDGAYSAGTGVKDNLGNEHQNYLRIYDYNSKSTYVTFYLGGKYSKFAGLCAPFFNDRANNKTTVFEIYGDDKLLFTSTALTKGVAPQEFSVDVTGVTYLKIVAKSDNTNAAIFDAVLTK